MDTVNTFRKDDQDKPRWSLLPRNVVSAVVSVLEFGASKYGADNWKECKSLDRYYDAAMRHLEHWKRGNIKDEETGLPSLAHAVCCLMFIMYLEDSDNE